MYANLAYLGKVEEDIVDLGSPLLITAVGYYRIHSSLIRTWREKGRGDYQLIYVASGKIHLLEGTQEKIISKGNMILFRPRERQVYRLCPEDKPEVYWVHFTGAEVDSLLDHYEMPHDKNVFFTGTSADYQWLFKQMIQELQLRRINYGDLMNISLRHLLLSINRCIKEGNKMGTDTLNEVERATHYFNENYNKTICIKDYAKERHMSECWFNRTFKQVTKVTPMQYILSLRIVNAISLIETTEYNVTQVANAVGYDDPYYFSRLFRKQTGMSPSEYKKKVKGN